MVGVSKAGEVAVSIDESTLGRWSRLKKARKDRAEGDEPAATIEINNAGKGAHGSAAPVAIPIEVEGEFRPWLPPLTENGPENLPEALAEADEDETLNEEEAAIAAEMNLPDIDTLEEKSDFQVFMKDGVPDKLRRLALRRLWSSNPLFGFRDGLNDYDEDFTLISDFVYNTGAMANFKESGKLPEAETDEQVAETEEEQEQEASGAETDQNETEETTEPENSEDSDDLVSDEDELTTDDDPELG